MEKQQITPFVGNESQYTDSQPGYRCIAVGPDGTRAEISEDGKTIIVTVPINLKKRGGRKQIVVPPGAETAPPQDESLTKLVAKAHQWLRMLECGQCTSILDLAKRENVDNSYVTKVLRLTLLAPDIVTAIVNRRQPTIMTWRELRKPFPSLWTEQREKWGIPEPA